VLLAAAAAPAALLAVPVVVVPLLTVFPLTLKLPLAAPVDAVSAAAAALAALLPGLVFASAPSAAVVAMGMLAAVTGAGGATVL
jgi:hypothetical protein